MPILTTGAGAPPGGASPPANPSLDFSQATNSQEYFFFFIW